MLRLAGLTLLFALSMVVIACGGGGGKKPTATASVALSTQQACAIEVAGGTPQYPTPAPTSGPPPTVQPQPTTTADGLQIIDIQTGSGAQAKASSCVTVKYIGWLQDGTIFDSSDIEGGSVQLPLDQVIKGWTEGVPGMKVGGKRRLIIPPALAYGAQYNNTIPPNATLTFDIELVSVK